jgi:membrane protease subunit HflK
LPIGFVEADEPMGRNQPRTLLWTKPHAKEEFSLVLGDGTELVAVNALVYFKISENPDEFRDYVYRQTNPEDALLAFAYRALMEATRGKTLDDVLSVNRAAFARQLADSIRSQVRSARLGLDVIDLSLLNIHPPIEAGGSYLDVINARLDAGRRVTEAESVKQVALLDAEMRGTMAIAAARVGKSRRVSAASSDVAEFKALNEASVTLPRTLQLRLWIEALESVLSNQRLYLIDQTLLDTGSELLLDTRSTDVNRLPVLEAIPRAPLPE